MSRIEAAPHPVAEDVTDRERPLWPAVVLFAGVVASIAWVCWLGWWLVRAAAAAVT